LFLTPRTNQHTGFEKPSAIQQRGIVPFCRGYDVIQQAQSGTGKTATFCAGILHQARTRCGRAQRSAKPPPRVGALRARDRAADPPRAPCWLPQLDYSLMETQALVLGPTRELAQQIEKARGGCARRGLAARAVRFFAAFPPEPLAPRCAWLRAHIGRCRVRRATRRFHPYVPASHVC
jgi:hypothetical protein